MPAGTPQQSHVNTKQHVIGRNNQQRISRMNHTTQRQRRKLRERNLLSRPLQIHQGGSTDQPFGHGRPKMNSKGTCFRFGNVVQHGNLKTRSTHVWSGQDGSTQYGSHRASLLSQGMDLLFLSIGELIFNGTTPLVELSGNIGNMACRQEQILGSDHVGPSTEERRVENQNSRHAEGNDFWSSI